MAGLAPQEIGVGREGQPAGDAMVEAGAVLQAEEALGRPLAGDERRSRSSTSLVMSLALSASVRATRMVGTPQTSAASRAASRLRIAAWVGIRTLPPRWPHFFSDASWSSKWTPGDARLDIGLHDLEAVQRSAEACFGVGDDRREPVTFRAAFEMLDLVGACSVRLICFASSGPVLAG